MLHSIKWRITAFFILLSMGLMGLYVMVTKQTFESDKISYVFESKQIQNEQYAQNIAQQVSRVIFDARAILAGFNPADGRLSPVSERLLQGQSQINGLQVVDANTGAPLFLSEKTAEVFKKLPAKARQGSRDQILLVPIGETRFFAESTQNSSAGKSVRFGIVFDLQSPFQKAKEGEMLALVSESEIVFSQNGTAVGKEDFETYLNAESARAIGETSIKKIRDQRFLISVSQIPGTSLSVVSALEERAALKALQILFLRSLMFLFFAFCVTILIALPASNSITRSISDLRRVAEKIGRGDFDAVPEYESKDEMGTLANAFKTMGQEIKNLLKETVHQARMASELQTAKIVQENLFPKAKVYKQGKMSLAGASASSSECSGDWWYYFDKGNYLYLVVADATGHGTPAALITAAARSIFSYIRVADLGLEQIAELWHRSIFECSNGQVCMTALLARVDVTTGEMHVINASHVPPLQLRSDEKHLADYVPETLWLGPSSRLGDGQNDGWRVHTVLMKPGDILVFYTDGIFDIKNAQGRNFREKAFEKAGARLALESGSAEGITSGLFDVLNTYGDGRGFVDDVTILVLQFERGKYSDSFLPITG